MCVIGKAEPAGLGLVLVKERKRGCETEASRSVDNKVTLQETSVLKQCGVQRCHDKERAEKKSERVSRAQHRNNLRRHSRKRVWSFWFPLNCRSALLSRLRP
jgi:hypothetical protein